MFLLLLSSFFFDDWVFYILELLCVDYSLVLGNLHYIINKVWPRNRLVKSPIKLLMLNFSFKQSHLFFYVSFSCFWYIIMSLGPSLFYCHYYHQYDFEYEGLNVKIQEQFIMERRLIDIFNFSPSFCIKKLKKKLSYFNYT